MECEDMKSKNGKATTPRGRLVQMGVPSPQDKLAQLLARTLPVSGNTRTDGTINYIFPNRAARRKASRQR